MSKKLGIPPKNVETNVSAQAEAKGKLWDAVPMRPDENLKAWFPRAARELGWSARRVRAFWNDEVRRVDYLEIVTLNRRIASAKAAENRHQEHANAIRQSMEMGSAHSALDGGSPRGLRDEMAPDRGMVPRSDG